MCVLPPWMQENTHRPSTALYGPLPVPITGLFPVQTQVPFPLMELATDEYSTTPPRPQPRRWPGPRPGIGERDGVEVDMAELVDQEQRHPRVRRRGGERLALAVGHQRIAATVHQDEVAVQLRQVVEREVEAVDLAPHPLRQRLDQPRH